MRPDGCQNGLRRKGIGPYKPTLHPWLPLSNAHHPETGYVRHARGARIAASQANYIYQSPALCFEWGTRSGTIDLLFSRLVLLFLFLLVLFLFPSVLFSLPISLTCLLACLLAPVLSHVSYHHGFA